MKTYSISKGHSGSFCVRWFAPGTTGRVLVRGHAFDIFIAELQRLGFQHVNLKETAR